MLMQYLTHTYLSESVVEINLNVTNSQKNSKYYPQIFFSKISNDKLFNIPQCAYVSFFIHPYR